MLRYFAIAMLAFCGPALAQQVVDGSDRNWPRSDIAKIMEIIDNTAGVTGRARIGNLHRAEGEDRIYCGVIAQRSQAPFMVDIYAGVAWILWDALQGDDRSNVETRVGSFGCLDQ